MLGWIYLFNQAKPFSKLHKTLLLFPIIIVLIQTADIQPINP